MDRIVVISGSVGFILVIVVPIWLVLRCPAVRQRGEGKHQLKGDS
jgi:hypothetical protein